MPKGPRCSIGSVNRLLKHPESSRILSGIVKQARSAFNEVRAYLWPIPTPMPQGYQRVEEVNNSHLGCMAVFFSLRPKATPFFTWTSSLKAIPTASVGTLQLCSGVSARNCVEILYELINEVYKHLKGPVDREIKNHAEQALRFYNECARNFSLPVLADLNSVKSLGKYFCLLCARASRPQGQGASTWEIDAFLRDKGATIRVLLLKTVEPGQILLDISAILANCVQMTMQNPDCFEFIKILATSHKLIPGSRKLLTACAESSAMPFIRELKAAHHPIICVSINHTGQVFDPCENCREWILEGGILSHLNLYVEGMIVPIANKDLKGPVLDQEIRYTFVSNLTQLKQIRGHEVVSRDTAFDRRLAHLARLQQI